MSFLTEPVPSCSSRFWGHWGQISCIKLLGKNNPSQTHPVVGIRGCAFQHRLTFQLEWLLIVSAWSLTKLMLHTWTERRQDSRAGGQCAELLFVVFVRS